VFSLVQAQDENPKLLQHSKKGEEKSDMRGIEEKELKELRLMCMSMEN
jgi:hypothetical protein